MSVKCQRCGELNNEGAKFCTHCGAIVGAKPAAADADPLIGRTLLGRYSVSRVLGEGGMGKVYLAEQRMGQASRQVAIKTLHPALSRDEQLVARFHRECETVIGLRHPNTVQFYDFGELDDGTLIIVMEYIAGKDLATVIEDEGPLSIERVDRILIQICGSLQEAHGAGVVHRDLKPENVLLTQQAGQRDFVKVLDFGIAKQAANEAESKKTLTKHGTVLGTPPYMSPEQFSGTALDARSDIYSLAIMTYEMLAGSLPFAANTPWEWATQHLTAEPKDIRSAAPHIPEDRAAALMKNLSKVASDRDSSATDYLSSFTGLSSATGAWALATHPGVSAKATPAPEPTNPRVTSPTADIEIQTNGGASKWLAIAAAISLLAVGGFYVFGMSGAEVETQSLDTTLIASNGSANLGTDQPGTIASPPKELPPGVEPPAPKPTKVEEILPPATTPKPEVAAKPEEAAKSADAEKKATKKEQNAKKKPDKKKKKHSAVNRLVRSVKSKIRSKQLDAAIVELRNLQNVAPSARETKSLRAELGKVAARKIGLMLMSGGNCRKAQSLYKKLRSVKAHGNAKRQFTPDNCRVP